MRRALGARELALVAVFAALMAVLGLPGAFAIPGTPVPVTAQTLGVMLAGCLLAPRTAVYAMLTFLALVAAGLPLLAGGRGGLGVFAGPSVGYLVAMPVAAGVISLVARSVLTRSSLSGDGSTRPHNVRRVLPAYLAANVLGGVLVVYALGIPGTALRTDLSLPAAAVSALAYLPGDLIKAVVAAVVAASVVRAYPRITEFAGAR